MASLVLLGTVARPHGIKGEFSIQWHADSLSLLEAPLWLQSGQQPPKPIRVRQWRMHKGRPLVLLDGIDDRNDAELLRGASILIDRADLPSLEDDEFYVEDILGCDIFLEDGQLLGRLDHVEFPAGQPMWIIIDTQGREILFPAQPCFIHSVDLETPSVTIAPPEGLLELYQGATE